MSDIISAAEVAKFPRLTYSREFFADYLTTLISRIRQSGETDAVYSGATPHPLISLQTSNQTQLTSLHITLVAPAFLKYHPFAPTERFIVDVNTKSTATPKLNNGWDDLWRSIICSLSALLKRLAMSSIIGLSLSAESAAGSMAVGDGDTTQTGVGAL